MRHGKDLEWHAALAAEGDYTRAWLERPDLPTHLGVLLEMFHDLSASRSVTMSGPGPIPVSEVLAYCQLYGIDDVQDRADLLAVIRTLDGFFLEEHRRQR